MKQKIKNGISTEDDEVKKIESWVWNVLLLDPTRRGEYPVLLK